MAKLSRYATAIITELLLFLTIFTLYSNITSIKYKHKKEVANGWQPLL